MDFWRQLQLLMWKNFILRKRHLLWTIVELLWPLFIFLLLAWVRGLNQPVAKPSAFYAPRALPSAGIVPFIQSLVCEFDNKPYYNQLKDGFPDYSNSSFERLFQELAPILSDTETLDRIQKFPEDLSDLGKVSSYMEELWKQYTNSTVPEFDLNSIFRDPDHVKQFLLTNTSLDPTIVDGLMSAKINGSEVQVITNSALNVYNGGVLQQAGFSIYIPILLNPDILFDQDKLSQLILTQLTSPKILNTLVCNKQIFGTLFVFPANVSETDVQTALCGLDTATMTQISQELQDQIDLDKIPSELAIPEDLRREAALLQTNVEEVMKDVNALQLLMPVFEELETINNMLGDSNKDGFREAICGTQTDKISSKVVQNTEEETCDNHPQLKTKLTNLVPQCRVDACNRTQCGESGLSKEQCEAMGCCYDSELTITWAQSCYYVPGSEPPDKIQSPETCASFHPECREECGWTGITDTACLEQGCCYDDTIKCAKKCFYKPEDKCGRLIWGLIHQLGEESNTQGASAEDAGFVELSRIFLKGKIFYTPETPLTRTIIKQMNATFEEVAKLEDLATQWLNFSSEMRTEMDTNGVVIERTLTWLVYVLSDNVTGVASPPFPTTGLFQRSLVQKLFNISTIDIKSVIQLQHFLNRTAPKNLWFYLDEGDAISQTILNIFECITLDYYEGVITEREMERKATSEDKDAVKPIASVVFLDVQDNTSLEMVPSLTRYKIRQDIAFTPSTSVLREVFWSPGPSASYPYINFGFVFLQDMVERAFINLLTNNTLIDPGVYTQQFPAPCYIYDEFFLTISHTFPLFMVLAWVFTVAFTIKSIVHEKEKRLKEVMKMMGLGNNIHWIAWFLNGFWIMTVTVFLLVAVLKYGKIINHSNSVIIFFLLMTYMMSTLMMCFLISVFFSHANIAAACGGIIYIMTFLPYTIFTLFEVQMNVAEKAAACLLSTTGFGIACGYFARYEQQGIGIQWENFYSSPITDDKFSLGYALGMIVLDGFLYALATWYLETVRPGHYGIPRPWYFPFQKSYWLGTSHEGITTDHVQMDYTVPNTEQGTEETLADGESLQNIIPIEREPTHLPLGISIHKLVKLYKHKKAVDNLSLNFYEDQITSFLGHNGAGKTTTMSVLTGLFPPSSGTACVYGNDIRSDMTQVRKSLGFCPQHDVLFGQLTVEEHLWFFAMLKGMKKKDVPAEIEKFLADTGLESKRHELSSKLSGGMQRKLSVAMAFVGGSKTIILDEPTAGVDPYARRGIWELLLKYKKGHTIMLSTHFMDEADVLGDRIAIISSGQLRCVGSSLFLKGHYGKGYFLTLVKKEPLLETELGSEEGLEARGSVRMLKSADIGKVDEAAVTTEKIGAEEIAEGIANNGFVDDEGVSSAPSGTEIPVSSSGETSDPMGSFSTPLHLKTTKHCNEIAVSKLVKSFVPNAELVENIGQEMTYCLPTESAHDGNFEKLFSMLDESLETLHIASYGISDTTLEEVFLRVAKESFHQETVDEPDEDIAPTSIYPEVEISDRVSGPKLILKQFAAVFVKRFHSARRNKRAFLAQTVLPAVFVCMAMSSALIVPAQTKYDSLELSPEMFHRFDGDQFVFYSNEAPSETSANLYTSTIIDPPGLGNKCVKESCDFGSLVWTSPPPVEYPTPNCSCSTGAAVCPAGAGGPPPPQAKTFTGDILQNITSYDNDNYLLSTNQDFTRKRYGGLSFGDIRSDIPVEVGSSSDLHVRRMATRNNAKAWFKHKGFHQIPIYINVLNNVLLRANMKNTNEDPRKYGIIAYNHPMNFTRTQLTEQELMRQSISDVMVATFVIVALSFVPASFVVYLVSERASKSKHLHIISGVNRVVYWMSNFAWDMVNYLVPVICCILVFIAFSQDAYASRANFPATLCLLLLYGWSITPLMYPAAFYFKVPSSAYIFLFCINFFIGFNTTITTFVLDFFQDQELNKVNDILKLFFLVFPNFCLGRGLMNLARNQLEADIFSHFGEDRFKDPFSWEIIGRIILALVIQGFVGFAVTLFIEYKSFIKCRPKNTMLNFGNDAIDDKDVVKEKKRVKESGYTGDVLKIVDLVKIYRTKLGKKNIAVKGINVGVPKGECFGLLGVNGAGKTTTFQMLTGDTSLTSGNAFVNNQSILSGLSQAHKFVGYCPQFDALDDLLTAREHLTLYARLRGVPDKDIDRVVEWGLNTLDLVEYADRISGGYSGGNKRKLSTAISLVGNPQLIYLDEPTTGMDPRAKRFLWNVINRIVKNGKTVILTSHSMEECEALCNRVAIMVNGEFKCLGSPQHLKNRFGDGYTVIIRIGGSLPDLQPVQEFFSHVFPNSVLKEQHHNMIEYQLPKSDLSLSEVFHHLENSRSVLNIEEYSVTQTTLDQVFINFAKMQREGEDGSNSDSNSPTCNPFVYHRTYRVHLNEVRESTQDDVYMKSYRNLQGEH